MPDELETVKNRVRKLLALSKSDNENEAAAALEKANELLEKYGITEEGLRFEMAGVKSSKTYIPWKTVLAAAVAWLYCCQYYRDYDSGLMCFAGERLDVFMAGEMYSYLLTAVERCAKKSIRKNAQFRFRRDFKYGMASRLYDRIMELGESCSWAPRRDVKIAEAAEWLRKQITLSEGKTKKTWLNRVAVEKGEQHGDGVSLVRQTGYSPAAQITAAGSLVQGELF